VGDAEDVPYDQVDTVDTSVRGGPHLARLRARARVRVVLRFKVRVRVGVGLRARARV